MHPLLVTAMLSLDMVSTLTGIGLLGGIIMLVIFFVRIKNPTALFHDPKKIRSVIMFGVPGLILFAMGLILIFVVAPMNAYIYIGNYGDKEGRIEVNGSEHKIAAGTWEKIDVRTKEDSYSIKGYLGDSVVFDTTMGEGSYIASLSDEKILVAEEVEYSTFSFSSGSSDLAYEILMSPGIAQFSSNLVSDLYDFDEEAPETISMSKGSGSVRKFDLKMMGQAEMFKMLMDAMGEEESEEEGDEEEGDSEDEGDGEVEEESSEDE